MAKVHSIEYKISSLNVSVLKELPRIFCLAENDLINIFIKLRVVCAQAGHARQCEDFR